MAIPARSALILAVLLCGFLAASLLLTAVSFGMERGDLDANPDVHVQDQLRLDRAGNIAILGFFVLEIAATWALMKLLRRGVMSRFKVAMRAALVFIGLGVLSYAIVLADLMGFALDPLLSVHHVLAHWILTILG